jgi:DNA-binding beta-propeller fold protein YncE
MTAATSNGNKIKGLVLFGVLAVVTLVVLNRGRSGGNSAVLLTRQPTGYPQLISIEPMPETNGPECKWTPASAGSSLVAMLERERETRDILPSEAAREAASKRKPIRTIHDPYLAYSAVAIDPLHNEVVMTDENLFSIVAYDRLENTAPKAKMSEPKRMIQGDNANIEFNCSLYIDPANGDIYAVNNDTLSEMSIFSHAASGNTKPTRSLETPMTTFGIAVDEKSQEMMLTVQADAAVVTFHKSAAGKDSPIRTLQGEQTLLADPHGIALDTKGDRIYVANWGTVSTLKPPASGKWSGSRGMGIGKQNWPVGYNDSVPGSGKFGSPSITVYPREARGDTAPLQVIQGPKTQLDWPTALSIDSERGELYVANDPSDSVLVFAANASGDAAPVRVLKGPKTLLKNPTSVYVDAKNNELWVANFGNHTATVFPRGAGGDVAPIRMIRSGPLDAPAPMMGNPHTVAYDSKRDEILVAN